MHTADDHDTVAGLSHERPCSSCGHPFHAALKCGDDLGDGVRCPCRCPVPGQS